MIGLVKDNQTAVSKLLLPISPLTNTRYGMMLIVFPPIK